MVEGLGHCGEDLEAERPPQGHGCGIGLDDRVKVHRGAALTGKLAHSKALLNVDGG